MDLTTQYISDNKGKIISAIIPIDVYKHFLKVISDSNNQNEVVPDWHIPALKERLESYNKGEDPESDLDEFMDNILTK